MPELASRIEAASWERLPPEVRRLWLDRIAMLPPPPPLFNELNSHELTPESFDAREMADKIAQDAVLGGRILNVANSPRYGLRRPLTSVSRSLATLGFSLVKTVISTYLIDDGFSPVAPLPDGHAGYVRRWTAGAAVLAFRWAKRADLRDPAAAATVALLSRLGTVLLGLAQPPPDENYRGLEYETDRLSYELATWQLVSPLLSGELARHWQVPRPVPELLELLWKPAAMALPPDPLNAQLRLLVLVSASLELAALTPGRSCELIADFQQFFAASKRRQLYSNLEAHRLLAAGRRVWRNAGFRREFDTVVA